MEAERVTELLSQMSISDEVERNSLLNSVKPFFLRRDAGDVIKSVLNQSDLNVLFETLRSGSEETVDTCCSVIKLVAQYVEQIQLHTRYANQINECLVKGSPPAKKCILEILTDAVASSSCDELLKNESILKNSAICIMDSSTSVGEAAQAFLVSTSMKNNGNTFFSSPILPILREASESQNAIIRIRVFTVVVNVAASSPQLGKKVEEEGFVSTLMSEVCNTKDILSQLAAVEVLADLADSESGLRFLKSQDILDMMDKTMGVMEADPMGELVMPSFIKFFGRASRNSPEIYSSTHKNFYNILNSILKHQQGDVLLAIETVAIISIGPNGKKAIENLIDSTVIIVSNVLKTGDEGSKTRTLSNCVQLLLKQTDNDSTLICQRIYEDLAKSGAIDKIIEMSKLPFVELSSAALNVLIEVSHHQWSITKFAQLPGFIETILNRDSTRAKETLELKFELILRISRHPDVRRDLSDTILSRITKYVEEGAFYVELQPRVTYEGEE